MALRLLAMECAAACSAVSRRAMHSSASTSSLTAALQRGSASTTSGQARGVLAQLGRRSFATDGPSLQTYKDYSEEQIREIEARVFGMHIGETGAPVGVGAWLRGRPMPSQAAMARHPPSYPTSLPSR